MIGCIPENSKKTIANVSKDGSVKSIKSTDEAEKIVESVKEATPKRTRRTRAKKQAE